MKKILILTLALVMLSGCGCQKETKKETMNCFFQNTNEGSEFTTNVDVEIVNDIVTDATATMNYKEENLAKTMCDIMKQASDADNDNLTCGDKFIIIKNYHKSISKEKLNKKDFINYMENQEFICE